MNTRLLQQHLIPLLLAFFAFTMAGCPFSNACGDLVYNEPLNQCVCPPGSEPDEARQGCVSADGVLIPWAGLNVPYAPPSDAGLDGSLDGGSVSDPDSDMSPTDMGPDALSELAPELTELSLSGTSVLEPVFDSSQLTYAVSVTVLVSELSLTPVALNPDATIVVSGSTITSGSSITVTLELGENEIEVQVQVPSGLSQTYHVTVTRGTAVLEQVAFINASNADRSDEFGITVALSGDTLAVGAFGEGSDATGIDGDQSNNEASESGAVYVFRRVGDTWTQEAYIKASNAEAGDWFGVSLALSGDTLAVGASREDSNAIGVGGAQGDNNADRSGAVYVFQRMGGTWTQEAYIKASNTDARDDFGTALSLFGDTLAVGASGEDSIARGVGGDQNDNTADGSGAVYVFQRTGALWVQEAYVKASNTHAPAPSFDTPDGFGSSVALSLETLAVGATGEDSRAVGVGGEQGDNNGDESGAVYVFRRAGGIWVQEAYIKASNTDENDGFGTHVALFGDTLAVGAWGESSSAIGVNGEQSDNSASYSGAVYVFHRTGFTWAQEAYIKASNTEASDGFGYRVALFGDMLVVGATGESSDATGVGGDQNNNRATESGAVYLFRRTAGAWMQEAYIKPAVPDPDHRFGSSVALSGDLLAVGASHAVVDGTQAGAVYVF